MSATPFDLWWQDLRIASLIGTARRDVAPPPSLGVEQPSGTREERLLASAALGDAVRRAGRLPQSAGVTPQPADRDDRLAAAGTAAQILNLLVHQPPVGARQRWSLLAHWLGRAAAAEQLVPPRLLPALLDLATKHEELRSLLPPVAGNRGRWLASHNPDWHWLAVHTETGTHQQLAVDPAQWALLPGKERVALLGRLGGLSLSDEPFLETCLDDRAAGVRQEAVRLLDAMPGTARAARMATRLRPLLRHSGTFRPVIEVGLPDQPDASGVRDGLVDPGPGRSRREWWLQRTVAATPLSTWTDLSGKDEARTVAMIRGDGAEPALLGLRDAARLQRDPAWARVLLTSRLQGALLGVLPPPEQEAMVLAHLRATGIRDASTVLRWLPASWGPELSSVVLRLLRDEKGAGHLVAQLRDIIPEALHPDALTDAEAWLARLAPDDDRTLRHVLRDVVQFQSLRTSILEAFR